MIVSLLRHISSIPAIYINFESENGSESVDEGNEDKDRYHDWQVLKNTATNRSLSPIDLILHPLRLLRDVRSIEIAFPIGFQRTFCDFDSPEPLETLITQERDTSTPEETSATNSTVDSLSVLCDLALDNLEDGLAAQLRLRRFVGWDSYLSNLKEHLVNCKRLERHVMLKAYFALESRKAV